jgi:hypothetical protein
MYSFSHDSSIITKKQASSSYKKERIFLILYNAFLNALYRSETKVLAVHPSLYILKPKNRSANQINRRKISTPKTIYTGLLSINFPCSMGRAKRRDKAKKFTDKRAMAPTTIEAFPFWEKEIPRQRKKRQRERIELMIAPTLPFAHFFRI